MWKLLSKGGTLFTGFTKNTVSWKIDRIAVTMEFDSMPLLNVQLLKTRGCMVPLLFILCPCTCMHHFLQTAAWPSYQASILTYDSPTNYPCFLVPIPPVLYALTWPFYLSSILSLDNFTNLPSSHVTILPIFHPLTWQFYQSSLLSRDHSTSLPSTHMTSLPIFHPLMWQYHQYSVHSYCPSVTLPTHQSFIPHTITQRSSLSVSLLVTIIITQPP